MSSDFLPKFGSKDPIRALYLAYQPAEGDPEGEANQSVDSLGHDELVATLSEEMHSQSAWTLIFHTAVAERLNLNATDHKCLDMIWRCQEATPDDLMTPGQLARETKLTTGAVTGVLDRLEQAGYVRREHDAGDRRRIIVRAVPERIKADVRPLFDWLSAEFATLAADFTDQELRRMIEFTRRSQSLLQRATDRLRELDAD